MKARQMQAQYDAQNTKTRRSPLRSRLAAGLAAAAAVLVCGTVTAGAANNWDYISLFNRYFCAQNNTHTDFDFSGMGLDINETYQCDGYTLDIRSVVAEANALHLIYSFRLDPEYEAQLPQTGEKIFGNCMVGMRLLDAAGEYVDIGSSENKDTAQNEDGSFDCICTMGLNYCDDLSDKTLELDVNGCAWAGTESFINCGSLTGGIETPLPSQCDYHEYSLAGISYIQGVNLTGGITLTDGAYSAAYDSMTISPLRISFACTDVSVIPDESDEPGVTVGGGAYCWCCEPDETDDIAAEIDDHCPVPDAYLSTVLRSVTLIYSDGTEQDASFDYADGAGRTKPNPETYRYDLMDIDFAANFNEPVSIDDLSAIRINGIEYPVG